MTSTIGRTTTLAWNAINVGDEVTPMDVPVSTTTGTSPIRKARKTYSSTSSPPTVCA